LNHAKSGICTDGRLNIFSVPPTLAAFEKIEDCKIFPVTALSPDAPVSFVINNLNVNNYLNLADSFFVVRAKLERKDGGKPHSKVTTSGTEDLVADKVTISNNISSTFIKNISVTINETTVSTYENFFLRNALDNLLHTPSTVQESLVDGPQHMYARGITATSYNTESWLTRLTGTKSGEVFVLVVPFNVDLGSTNKFFPPGANIKITLSLNSPDFYLVKASSETNSHRLNIESIYLQITKASVLPSITEAHHEVFKKNNAIYPMRRVRTTERVVGKDSTDVDFDIFMSGQVPYNITLVFLPTKTLTGDILQEPMFFERHGLSSAVLTSDSKKIEYDFENERSAFFKNMRALNEEKVIIKYPEYSKGGLFFVYFDLSEGTPENVLRPVYRSNLHLSLKWKTPTDTALTLLMLTESVGHLEINGQHETSLILK